MTNTDNLHQKVCVDMLQEELSTPITTAKQSYRLLEMLARCFISTAVNVHVLTEEVYGNGVPGGIKIAVKEIKESQERLIEEMDGLEKYIKEHGISKPPTSSDKLLNWFVDKILPALVIGAIIGIANALLVAISFATALEFGWIYLP